MESIEGETTTLKARGKNVTFFMQDELKEYQINPEQWKEQNIYKNFTKEDLERVLSSIDIELPSIDYLGEGLYRYKHKDTVIVCGETMLKEILK